MNDHFLAFNTICDATEERQDAMLSLVDEDLDVLVVIGGFNSSNTTHLQEMAIDNGIPSYHIDGPKRILYGNRIEHKPLGEEVKISEGWLPEGRVVVGVTMRFSFWGLLSSVIVFSL